MLPMTGWKQAPLYRSWFRDLGLHVGEPRGRLIPRARPQADEPSQPDDPILQIKWLDLGTLKSRKCQQFIKRSDKINVPTNWPQSRSSQFQIKLQCRQTKSFTEGAVAGIVAN
jgi:hypothetical protein